MPKNVTIIQNEKGLHLRRTFRELYEYRELLWMLAWRDFRVRYAQTFLGLVWAIIEPLLTAIILSLAFNRIANASTFDVHPILFGLTGMLCWNYFSNVVSQGNTSLIMAQNMIKKSYFPRIVLPVSKALAAIPDFIIALIFTFIFWLIFRPGIATINALWAPLIILLSIPAAISLSIWFSALNIRFRDFKHIVPFGIRLGLLFTPIAYSTSGIDGSIKWLFFINPMTGIIEMLRWSLFNIYVEPYYYLISGVALIFFLFSGFLYFNHMQKNMADII